MQAWGAEKIRSIQENFLLLPGLRRAPFLAYLHFLHFVFVYLAYLHFLHFVFVYLAYLQLLYSLFVYMLGSLSSLCLACEIFIFVAVCASVCILALSLSCPCLQFHEHAGRSLLRTPSFDFPK